VTNYSDKIQWHPEAMLVASDDMLPVFTGLIEAAKKAADK
jgi:gamma-glutamyl-gamma-aminobutyrate hydrolase PuuD